MEDCNDLTRIVGATVRTALKVGGSILATRGILLTPDVINDVGGLAETLVGALCVGFGHVLSLINIARTVKK